MTALEDRVQSSNMRASTGRNFARRSGPRVSPPYFGVSLISGRPLRPRGNPTRI